MTTTQLNMERQNWLAERRSGIGGSDAAAILGLSRWKSRLELFTEKLGFGDPEFDIPEFMEWGNLLEPAICQRYADKTGYQLTDPGRFTIQRSTAYRFLICTVDRFIEPTDDVSTRGILEAKNVAGFKGDEWEDEPPVEYQIQAQHNMIVTGTSWGAFAVLFGGQKWEYFPFVKNERFCGHYIEAARDFWRCVEENDAPAADGSESSQEALRRLYPKETGETLRLPGNLIQVADRLEGVKKSLKRLQVKESEFKQTIQQAIGNATFGVLPNGTKFSLKTVIKPAHSVEGCSYRQLRRVKTK